MLLNRRGARGGAADGVHVVAKLVEEIARELLLARHVARGVVACARLRRVGGHRVENLPARGPHLLGPTAARISGSHTHIRHSGVSCTT